MKTFNTREQSRREKRIGDACEEIFNVYSVERTNRGFSNPHPLPIHNELNHLVHKLKFPKVRNCPLASYPALLCQIEATITEARHNKV